MAKLRIMTAAGVLDVQAYVSVFDNLIADTPQAKQNLLAFLQAGPPLRADLLQAAAGGPGSHKITQELPSGVEEAIDNTNCNLFAERDQRNMGQRSRVTIPIPDQSVANVQYLLKYAQTVAQLLGQNQTECCKFLYAIMMMTRCR